MTSFPPDPTALLVGASRGLGLAMAGELVGRGWRVVGTVRGDDSTPLHELAARHPDRVEIESLDVTDERSIAALHERLAGRMVDVLFVVAGVADEGELAIADVSTDEFVRVMTTNVLGPLRVVERLRDRVAADGVIGVMSSGQGSIANNEKGGHELYRASKAALNMGMRSYAARRADDQRALVLIAPGWIRTALGGPGAPLTAAEAIPAVVDVLLARRGAMGLAYLDRTGKTVPW